MIRLGVIENPRSLRNRHASARAQWPAQVPFARPESTQDLPGILADFHAREVALIAVSGGDGTLREVLTALPAAYGSAPLPDLAVIASGKTNLVAADVGAAAADRLLAAAAQGRMARRTERAVLEIERVGMAGAEPIRGFLFGAGAFATGTDLANARVHKAGIVSNLAVALSIAGTVGSALVGRARQQMLAGQPMQLSVPGREPVDGAHFLTMATTLDRFVMGLRPFWGEGSGAVRWTDIDAPPRHLLRALPAVLRGRPRPWMAAAGYRSGRSDSLHLQMSSPFIVDGETFQPGPGGIRLRAGAPVGFVQP